LQRFQNEAQAAACLHHTNIVPVHAVGSERGVHFYAMQFIDGQTLAAVIRQLREPPDPQPDHAAPAADTEPLTRQLTQSGSGSKRGREYYQRVAELGVQAAEALDHAHQMGIVHRDVKPGNLMLDGSGRLWVTDFGLAHIQHGEASLTRTGDLVGTLRYMSPEQALAKRVPIDHRTDVYSLGVTLYELLTLRPACDGKDRQELLRQIAFDEPARPRRLDRTIPAELEVIVLKAMEKNPADRYATAKELADDLRRWLEDRPIWARRPGVVQRLRKWSRRHRALVRAATALVLVVLLLGGAALTRERWQQAAAERAVEAALGRADLLQEQERWEEALGVLDAAAGHLEGRGLWALRSRVERSRRDVEMLARLEKACLQHAAGGKKGFDDVGADRLYAEAFARYGLDVTALSPEEAAERLRASMIGTSLIAALDNWASIKDRLQEGGGGPLREVADLADDDPWRQRVRRADGGRDRAALERLTEEEGTGRQPAANVVRLAGALEAVDSWAVAERLLRRAQAGHPANFWINFRLAYALNHKKPPDPAAAGFYRAALALRPQSPACYSNLGATLLRQGELAEAEAACQQASTLQPDLAAAHNNLGNALLGQGKLEEAEAAYHKALALRSDLPEVHYNRGNLRLAQGKLAEAVTSYQQAIALDADYLEAQSNLGVTLQVQGKPREAEAAFRQAIKLQPESAGAYCGLGKALQDQKRLPEAEAAYREGIAHQPDSALAHFNLGAFLEEQKKLAEAVKAYQQAIAHQPDYAEAHWNLGLVLLRQGSFTDALTALKRGHELGSRRPNWPSFAAEKVREAERWAELEAKLPSVLAGEAQPADAAERIRLARLCQKYKQRYAVAARLFTDAFAEQTPPADNLNKQFRYDAACVAALAGCGKGQDALTLDEKERTRLRRQALDWLRAHLEAWRRVLDKEPDKARPRVLQALRHWLADTDFAGVRGADALKRLPEAERADWQRLWEEVEALRQRAAAAPQPGAVQPKN
jgi:tetratricopeptide (TPR) repeat protein